MFKAKDVGTRMVITTRADMPIYDAIRLMTNRHITGLPVVDADLNLIGVLSEKDVLKLLYETVDRSDQKVADYMETDVVAVDINATLIDLCDCLMGSGFRVVPLTEGGKLCAVASRSDVIQGILRVKRQAL